MNRILTYGLAATFVTMLTPPVFADKDGHGGGGGGRGGGGGAHISAPSAPAHVSAPRASAPQFSAPRTSVAHAPTMRAPEMRSAPAPRIATQAPQMRTAPVMRSQPNTFTPNNNVAQTRSLRQRNSPTVAFGGSVNNNAALNAQNARNNFAATNQSRTFNSRGSVRDFRVPLETSRDWDRGRVHTWHNHHFRYFNGDWVIIDAGVPYGYYGDTYGDVTPYSDYTYDSTSSGSLVMSAQDRLMRLGYSPGPIDGVFGAQTRDAISDFQNDNNLPVTGNLDAGTVRALGL